jgi:hypothetical protein
VVGAVSESETPFRIYVVEFGKPRCLVATEDISVGEQLLYAHRHHLITDRDAAGIMYRPRDGEAGEWLINPFARSESARV